MSNLQQWSIKGFLEELKRITNSMPDRRFVFVLGAGASVDSGVKGAASLAKEWMEIIFGREQAEKDVTFEYWLKSNPLRIQDWDEQNLAAYYPTIFERCFTGDHESGYAELEKAIEQGSPSFGYAVLAWVMTQTRHNMVITTNFDNLVADSLYIYGRKTPHVIGHETLAGYLKPLTRRPVVAKIHRDLFTDPINDSSGTGELKKQWAAALKNVFKFYTPVFIGYGGNDGSLMNFLESLDAIDINGRPFWCYYAPHGQPNGAISRLIEKHGGVLVPAQGFNELMFEIGNVLGYDRHKQREMLEQHTQNMLGTLEHKILGVYRDGSVEIKEKLSAGQSINQKTWLDWTLEAEGKQTVLEKFSTYKQAIESLPDSSELHYNYASELHANGEFDLAEKHYRIALGLNPSDLDSNYNLAVLLDGLERSDEAVKYYEAALDIDQNNINALNNYAILLKNLGRDLEAERFYAKLLDINNDIPEACYNYANLLHGLGKHVEAEYYYNRAIEIDPKDVHSLNNLANMLIAQKRYDEAEILVKNAIQLEEQSPIVLSTYAELLFEQGHVEQAKMAIEKAIAIDPENQTLKSIRVKIDQAVSE